MDPDQLAQLLQAMGCPPDQCNGMAAQLLRRAKQLAAQRQQTEEETLTHLLKLMSQGWAAKERGFS
ncbi:MAG: hypothetical protein ACO34E_11240 [Limisphaerales bacterium]